MKNFSVFALGVSPTLRPLSLSNSLQMDILPKFVEWGKQGEVGRRKLNQAYPLYCSCSSLCAIDRDYSWF